MSGIEEDTPIVRVRDSALGEQLSNGMPKIYRDVPCNSTQQLIDARYEENATQYRFELK